MESPCIRMCTLNEENICLGCGRLLNEITSWASYSDKQREAMVGVCAERIRRLEEQSLLLADARKRYTKGL